MTNVTPLPQPAPFDEFWRMWKILDRNIGKTACRQLYGQITNGGAHVAPIIGGEKTPLFLCADAETINRGARAYKDAMVRQDTETRFICTPIVWLRQGRWEDYE